MTYKTVDIYVHSSKEQNAEAGERLGLQGEALHLFLYAACEVQLTLKVNTYTGDAEIIAVDGKVVQP